MMVIGMIALFCGIIIISKGWISNPKEFKTIGLGVLMALGGTFVGVGINPAKDMPDGSPAMVTLGIILIIISIIQFILNYKKEGKLKIKNMFAVGAGLIAVWLFVIFVLLPSSYSSSNSNEIINKCGETSSEHYAKTRQCNAKDNELVNCTYSNCTCNCSFK